VITLFNPFRSGLLVACCLALFGALSCHREPTANALFPSSNEAAGWVKSSGTRTYDATNLWRYIDGEAERYLTAGVQSVSTADYKFENKLDAVVDIYTMKKAASAKRMFESEPTGDARSVQLGDSARSYGQSLIFRKDSYLVRIVAYQDLAETAEALLELGRGVEKRMAR